MFVIFTLYAASLIFAVLYAFSISLKGVDEFHEKKSIAQRMAVFQLRSGV